jgi:hypothetical protein
VKVETEINRIRLRSISLFGCTRQRNFSFLISIDILTASNCYVLKEDDEIYSGGWQEGLRLSPEILIKDNRNTGQTRIYADDLCFW